MGTALCSYIISTALLWVSWFALLTTLAQSGCRKSDSALSEVAVFTMVSWHKHTHVTRANLRWFIGGVAVPGPMVQQLRSLTDHEYALIIPPPRKADRVGIVWGDKLMFFPVRFNAPYCAALQPRCLDLCMGNIIKQLHSLCRMLGLHSPSTS